MLTGLAYAKKRVGRKIDMRIYFLNMLFALFTRTGNPLDSVKLPDKFGLLLSFCLIVKDR